MQLTRLLRFLTLVAMLFSPISMAAGHAAMAMPAPSAAMADQMGAMPVGHCADMSGDQDKQDKSAPTGPNIDCMIACAAMPAADFSVAVHPLFVAFIEPARLTGALHGLHPESDPPPPRHS